MKKNIIICGHICLDIIPKIQDIYNSPDQIVISGGLTNINKAIISGGGPVFNVSKTLSKLIDKKSINLFINAKTGDDYFSQILEEKIIQNKIDYTLSKEKKLNTSYTIVIATPKIDRAYLHYSGANDFFSTKDLVFPKTGLPGIFHFGYPQLMKKVYSFQGELTNILLAAKEKEYITSVDMSLVSEKSECAKKDWKEIMKRALPKTDILFIGLEEAHFILNTENYFKTKKQYLQRKEDLSNFYTTQKIEKIKEELFSLGANLILLKAGKNGAFIFSKKHHSPFSKYNWNNISLEYPQKKIKNIKNSVGAGDIFAAGFIQYYITGESPENCLKNAVTTATKSLLNYSAEL